MLSILFFFESNNMSKEDTYGIFQTDLVIHIFVKDAYNKNIILLYKNYINILVFLYNL